MSKLVLAAVLAAVSFAARAAPQGNPNLSLPGVHRYGFDVSDSWAALTPADWKKAVAKGRIGGQPIDFAFFQATIGGQTIAKFKDNWAAVKATPLIHGAYHVFDYRQKTTVRKQAEAYLLAVTGSKTGGSMGKGALPPVIDLEWITQTPSEASYVCANQARILSDVFEWIHLVKAGTGSKLVIVYSNGGFWKNFGNTKVLASYPLWVANYNQQQEPSLPGSDAPCFPKNKRAEAQAKKNASRSPWKKWTFWQYYGETVSSSFKVEGLGPGAKDFVVFNGSLAQLRKLAK